MSNEQVLAGWSEYDVESLRLMLQWDYCMWNKNAYRNIRYLPLHGGGAAPPTEDIHLAAKTKTLSPA